MLTYKQAKEMMLTAKNAANGKPLENNTRLFNRGKCFAVRLHNTDIVEIYPNNTYRLYTGGWNTVTTRQRINAYAPSVVSTKKGVMYVHGRDFRPVALFQEGIKINSQGKPIGKVKTIDAILNKEKKIQKSIKKYINGFTEHVAAGKLEKPSGGDCWMCLGMVGANDIEHIKNHIKESYFVPSLLVKAAKQVATEYWLFDIFESQDKTRAAKSAKYILQKYFRKVKPIMLKEAA